MHSPHPALFLGGLLLFFAKCVNITNKHCISTESASNPVTVMYMPNVQMLSVMCISSQLALQTVTCMLSLVSD